MDDSPTRMGSPESRANRMAENREKIAQALYKPDMTEVRATQEGIRISYTNGDFTDLSIRSKHSVRGYIENKTLALELDAFGRNHEHAYFVIMRRYEGGRMDERVFGMYESYVLARLAFSRIQLVPRFPGI